VSEDGPDVGALLARFARPLSAGQRRAVTDLSRCRTPALGGTVWQCGACGRLQARYRSCGNRHCPKCQGGRRAAWLEREAGWLLPVAYHHLVFTLPPPLAELARANARLVYGLLFAASSAAVQELAAEPKYLGAQVGLTAVLHTWGQTLSLHPHVHLLATGGGLSCDRVGTIDACPRWRACRPGFFLPVRVLSRLFRGKFLDGLRRARQQGLLRGTGASADPGDEAAWQRWLGELRRQEWVVYSQPPCAGAEVVLKYLARYTYRVALSNARLLAATEETVTFRYKDYRHQGRQKTLTLAGEEFARRFMQHVLPRGLVRVRHYGLLANRGRDEKIRQCRRLLLAEGMRPQAETEPAAARADRCAACGQGELRPVGRLAALPEEGSATVGTVDSS
jgi:hypothetical protein